MIAHGGALKITSSSDQALPSLHTTLNWGTGGIRELALDVNKIEQMLKYRKASFPEVSKLL